MLISWNYPRRSQPYFVSCSHLPRPPSPPPTYLYQWYKYSTQWYKYSTQWYKYLYQWYKYICPMRAPPYLPHPFVVQIYLVPPYPALSPPTSSWYKNICTRGTKIFVPVVQISRAWRVVFVGATKNIFTSPLPPDNQGNGPEQQKAQGHRGSVFCHARGQPAKTPDDLPHIAVTSRRPCSVACP
jgi:hypothetical protein